MNATLTEPNWSPFDPHFLPDQRAQGKSHFQSAFFTLFSKDRRQALHDFYTYCRLIDDISDDPNLPLSLEARSFAFDQIENWLKTLSATPHPFWNRFAQSIHKFGLSTESLRGIIEGCRYDLRPKPLTFETWQELNDYVQGVAVCVGEVVLQILGVRDSNSSAYAQGMGRCVQYLNILRDIDEDFAEGKIFIPREYLQTLGISDFSKPFSSEAKQKAREELWRRAVNYRAQVHPSSIKCLPAEVMVGVYMEGAQKYWRHGDSQRLTSFEKLVAAIKSILLFGRR